MSNEQTSDKWLRPFSFSWKGPYHDRLEWVDAAGKKLSLDAILALLNAAPRPSLAAQEICRSYKIGEFNDLICCLDKGHSGEHNYVVKKPPFPTPARRECEHGNAYNECNRCNTSFQPTPATGETPRTDVLYDDLDRQHEAMAMGAREVARRKREHAERLERELAEARDEIKFFVAGKDTEDDVCPANYTEIGRRNFRIGDLLAQRDELRKQLSAKAASSDAVMALARLYAPLQSEIAVMAQEILRLNAPTDESSKP